MFRPSLDFHQAIVWNVKNKCKGLYETHVLFVRFLKYKYWAKHVAGQNKYTAVLDREQEGWFVDR
jgi:hypothetical protein